MTEANKNRFVLASVFDKNGISKFVKALTGLGYKIIATEGTKKEILKHGVSCISAESVSRNPNRLRSCIKTISFYIEAGILFDRDNSFQTRDAQELKIKEIDIVICNFVPLDTVKRNLGKKFNIENIDVGGPLIVRSAATNFKDVLVVVDPNDYEKVVDVLKNKEDTIEFRKKMALKAFAYTSLYDQNITKILKKPFPNHS